MIFTRSPSGLNNFGRFFGANITVYVEGRLECTDSIEDPSRPDSKYYSALCKAFLPEKKAKIKLTGNKKNALEYHTKILEKGIKNSIVIVDRDYDGLLFHRQESPCLILTHGYSWENDFWTVDLTLETLGVATASEMDDALTGKIRRMSKRLARLSAFNVATHCNAHSFFDAKGNSKGINIDPASYFPVKKSEHKRLTRKLLANTPICSVMAQAYDAASKLPPTNLIQGHLWEHACLLLISHSYTKLTSITLKNNRILANIALSTFSANPAKFLANEVQNYYKQEFKRAM